MTTLGPIEIEVIRNALTAAAAEMDVTIWRTSRSTIVRELLDYSTAVFDADGYNVAQSARIPQHLNSMGAALRTLLEQFVDPETWGPDDVIATNDPYCGAQHLNDVLVFKPVFHEGRRVGYVGALCHHIDMGGLAPGSYAATATEIFQEGLRIPPVKLIEGGRLNRAVWAMIGQNVRKPALMLGDLQSELASLDVGAAAIHRLAARYGADTLIEACRRILDMSEASMRAAIRAMPDGTYAFEDFLDDDGISGEPVRLHASVTIAGDEITVDLSACADQQAGPVNCTPAMSHCAVYYAVIAATDGSVMANAGCYRPVRIVSRPGSVVNCRAPACVAHRVATTHRLANVLFGALHKALPDRIPAAYYGGSYVATFQTIAEDGSREVLVEIEIGGTGAHPQKDGVNAWSFGMHNNANIPIEMIEATMPLSITRYGLLPGSGGAGRFRGGLGLVREWRVESPACVFTANMDRFRFPPYGLAGGKPGSLGRLTRVRGGEETPIAPKSDGVALRRGDIVRLETSGGGGFGDPTHRDATAAARDRSLGYTAG
ncbi:MAG: hydantoinase B/oxoprolinase family protein [Acetobacteraceae bacterium]|nr:hydantoinase B/oxoprolinase family protein [Acetobacteraceae bacterium]